MRSVRRSVFGVRYSPRRPDVFRNRFTPVRELELSGTVTARQRRLQGQQYWIKRIQCTRPADPSLESAYANLAPTRSTLIPLQVAYLPRRCGNCLNHWATLWH